MYKKDDKNYTAFLAVMQEPTCDSWVKGKDIIKTVLSQQAIIPTPFALDIRFNARKIKNLMMLVYVYSLNVLTEHIFDIGQAYRDLRQSKTQIYVDTYNFLVNQPNELQQQGIELILQYFSSLLAKKQKFVNGNEIRFLVYIFSIFEIKRERNVTISLAFIENLREMQLPQGRNTFNKEVEIIQSIFYVLAASNGKSQGNLGLLLNDNIIGTKGQRNLNKFAHLYGEGICDMAGEVLLKMSEQLTRSGLNFHIAEFILMISNALVEGEEFYKLKLIYEQFIMPNLIRFGKCINKKDDTEEIIVDVAELYIIGFLNYCDVGEEGIKIILANVDRVKNSKIRTRWVELAYMAAERQGLDSRVDALLDQMKLGKLKDQGRAGRHNFKSQRPWQITARNIRPHKLYKKEDSAYRGIANKNSQCYMISTVQALFMTGHLFQLLKRLKRKGKTISAIYDMFCDLESKRPNSIKIDEFQSQGPKMFAQSMHQQDVYEYLIALMDQLQHEFKQEGKLKEFKELFEIELHQNLNCRSCKNQTKTEQSTYMHTIANSQKLKLQSSEELSDFNCQKCKSKSITKTTRVILNSLIFIVQINRFSVDKEIGIAKKELPTEKIARKFDNYSLVGIIFHIGRNVECGHYVYYAKINSRRWAEFNDRSVKEFQLQREDEEFQREFKAEKTPYILFYQRGQ